MKEELIAEILRPAAKALGWIIAGALLVMFIWAVVTYVVPVIRRRLYGKIVSTSWLEETTWWAYMIVRGRLGVWRLSLRPIGYGSVA